MSDLVKAIILGVVQGLTEFLPISSSGHLVLFEQVLNYKEGGLAFEVFVHFGTLIAVLIVFRKDILNMIRCLPAVPAFLKNGMKIQSEEDKFKALTLFIIIGSIPAAFLGLLFEDTIEQLFDSHVLVLVALMVTGIIMWSSRYTEEKLSFMNWRHSVWIGLAQAFAIIPGISRSGSTIVGGMWLGINRELTARFSFLLSVPVILGASILKLKDLLIAPPPAEQITNITSATIASAIAGYLAIIWLLNIIRKQKLEWFGVYCALVSIIGLIIVFT